MTEPKVVHEWTDPTYGDRWQIFIDDCPPHPLWIYDEVDGWIREEDGPSLMAAASELIRLAARVEELEGWQEEAFRDVIHAKAESKRLREALEFYAAGESYDGGSPNDYTGEEPVLRDWGKRATVALKEKPERNPGVSDDPNDFSDPTDKQRR